LSRGIDRFEIVFDAGTRWLFTALAAFEKLQPGLRLIMKRQSILAYILFQLRAATTQKKHGTTDDDKLPHYTTSFVLDPQAKPEVSATF
jgi:hypothetical protein